MRFGPNRLRTMKMDCQMGAGSKMMLQFLMWNHSLQRIQTPQVSETSSYRKLQYPGIGLKWNFSHEKLFSRIICLTGSLFNVVLGWGFVLVFMFFIIYLVLKLSDLSFSLPPCLLSCLLVKPKAEEEKTILLKPKWKVSFCCYINIF